LQNQFNENQFSSRQNQTHTKMKSRSS